MRSPGKSMEVCCSSYRQTLSLDPITSQSSKSLNLETSATRLANWLNLLMSIDVNWFWIRNHPKPKPHPKQQRSIAAFHSSAVDGSCLRTILSEVIMSDMLDGKNCWKYLYRIYIYYIYYIIYIYNIYIYIIYIYMHVHINCGIDTVFTRKSRRENQTV